MFYSHEVLTSRKYGVATVWLVATLGSKSNLKKINRKAILDVDVSKACQTIQAPEAPMALRLQGNLLYGVSRVYLQQCGYVLTDAQNAQNAMRMMLKIVKKAETDPEAGRARPDQLILEDDPFFLPDLELPPLDFDISQLDSSVLTKFQYSDASLSLSPFGSQQLHDPSTPEGLVGGLVIPSTDSEYAGAMGGFAIPGGDRRSTSRLEGPSTLLGIGEDDGLLGDAGFDIDESGEIRQHSPGEITRANLAFAGPLPQGGGTGASARVRQEYGEGALVGSELQGEQEDMDFPMIEDILPEGEAFSTTTAQMARNVHDSSVIIEDGSSSTVAAPMRRKHRAARVIPLDQSMELRNSDLQNWNLNYLRNMAEASSIKEAQRAVTQAKKNAEYWIWGSGIGNIGRRLGGEVKTPLDMFYGDALFTAITGIDRGVPASKKRERGSGLDEEAEAESRRKIPRSSEEHVGRGEEDINEGMFMAEGGDDIELPRDAPAALDDEALFSAMPWNITASIRGSSTVARSGRPGIGGPSSVGGPADTFGRRGSRMISASPLHGRGQVGGLEALRSLEGEDEHGILSHEDFGFPPLSGPGPSSDADSDALPSHPQVRVREALDAEGNNFLAFVEDGINERRLKIEEEVQMMSDVLQAEAASDVDEITFEELLPPAENSKVVACQALMQVLALGSKGVLRVRQDTWGGEIGLRFVDKEWLAKKEAELQRDEGDEEAEGETATEEGESD